VGSKEIKNVLSNMKPIYKAPNEQAALLALEAFAAKWEDRYPRAVQSWTNNWLRLSTFLNYPERLRKLIDTTNNIVECYHAQLRKATKTKRVFDGDLAAQAHLPSAAAHRPREVAAPTAQLAIHILEHRNTLRRPDQHTINSNQQVVSLPRPSSLKITTTPSSTKVN